MFLVTGATGNVGREVVSALVGAGETVRGLTRNPAGADVPAGAEPVTGDLNEPESLGAALEGVSGVFLLPGYREMPGVLEAISLAGAERVVLLSGGCRSPPCRSLSSTRQTSPRWRPSHFAPESTAGRPTG